VANTPVALTTYQSLLVDSFTSPFFTCNTTISGICTAQRMWHVCDLEVRNDGVVAARVDIFRDKCFSYSLNYLKYYYYSTASVV
jgi:hypothetical protein